MMNDIPLTKEQRDFAAERHALISTYLNTKGLPKDDFYDVVVFGYLNAVKEYLNKPSLQKYSFSTIAWRKMDCALLNHYKSQNRPMRKGYTISLNAVVYGDEILSLEEVLSGPDRLMAELEAQLMLHDLAAKVTRQQMDVVRRRSEGYCLREIAKEQHTTINHIKELLKEAGAALLALGYGIG